MRDTATNRRYKLHQRLRKAGRHYSPAEKTIYVMPETDLTPWELELKDKFNYSIQTIIA